MIFFKKESQKEFVITIEVVPPEGSDPEKILSMLEKISHLPFHGFSVATNPVAKPRMCAMVLSSLIQEHIKKPSVFHCTIRDHNSLSLKSMLWGARALGLDSVLIASGDHVLPEHKDTVTSVGNVTVYELLEMAKNTGLQAGAVFDFRPETDGLSNEVKRLEKKIAHGAEYIVTQPLYDRSSAEEIKAALAHIRVPVILGILPLRTPRHAEFLHKQVDGIVIPLHIRDKITQAEDSVLEGAQNAKEMLLVAEDLFDGACIMPPFDHYEVLFDILG